MGSVIEKTALIMQLVSEHEPCSLKELTLATGMKKPALYLTLKSMVEVGFLDKSADNRYHLGPMLFELTKARRNEENARSLITSAAETLVAELNESVTVAAISGTEYRQLLLIHSNQTVRINDRVLGEMKFYRNATGHVLLAHASRNLRDKIIKIVGLPEPEDWPGINSREDLEDELRKIREAGIDFRKSVDGQAVFIAVPVAGEQLALGISVPGFRYQGEHAKKIEKALRNAARHLSADLQDID